MVLMTTTPQELSGKQSSLIDAMFGAYTDFRPPDLSQSESVNRALLTSYR